MLGSGGGCLSATAPRMTAPVVLVPTCRKLGLDGVSSAGYVDAGNFILSSLSIDLYQITRHVHLIRSPVFLRPQVLPSQQN
jgi:hypothetical protein